MRYQEASTIISAPLGRWTLLGGTERFRRAEDRRILSTQDLIRESDTRFYIRVDAVDPAPRD